jgi:hypothetical protein
MVGSGSGIKHPGSATLPLCYCGGYENATIAYDIFFTGFS